MRLLGRVGKSYPFVIKHVFVGDCDANPCCEIVYFAAKWRSS
jgi:hypothetical protein